MSISPRNGPEDLLIVYRRGERAHDAVQPSLRGLRRKSSLGNLNVPIESHPVFSSFFYFTFFSLASRLFSLRLVIFYPGMNYINSIPIYIDIHTCTNRFKIFDQKSSHFFFLNYFHSTILDRINPLSFSSSLKFNRSRSFKISLL